MKNVLKALFLFCFLTGCSEKKENEGSFSATNDNKVKVTLNVVAPKDDTFSLYYTNNGSIDFTQNDPIWKSIEGSPAIQVLTYELPQEVTNPQIRLDFGRNPEQEKIIIKKIAISYGDKIFEVSGRHIFNYFRPDPAKCTVDIDDNAIVPKIQNGVRQTPSLYPHQEILAKEISKLMANS